MILGVLNVLSAVSLLLIAAAGLAIIFGVMGVVNLAHGEFIMIGAYVSYLVVAAGLPPAFSLVLAPLVVAGIALVLEPIFFRHLYGKMMESILATWGLSIVLRQLAQMIFGGGYLAVPYATDASVSVLGTNYSLYRLLALALAALLVIGLFLIEKRTNLGMTARAVIADSELASSLGVNVARFYLGTMAAGAALAGLAGAVLAPLTSAYPAMGLSFLADSFFAVLVAGLGSLPGLVFSASVLGASKQTVAILVDPVWGSVALVVVALALVRFRRTT